MDYIYLFHCASLDDSEDLLRIRYVNVLGALPIFKIPNRLLPPDARIILG